MASAGNASRTRYLVLATLTVASLVATTDAEAQRRRRRRRTTTTQTTQTTQTGQTATTAQTAGDDGDEPAAAATTAATATTGAAATTATTSTAQTASATSTNATTSASTASTTAAASTSSARSGDGAQTPPPIDTSLPPAPRPAALDLRLGGGVVGRSFWFTDDLFMSLRPYNLPIAPAISAAVEWYPGAHFSRGVASMFGLVADGSFTFVFSSPDAQGRAYPTLAFNASGGLRTRLWLLDRIDVGLLLGFAMQNFSIDRSAVAFAPAMGISSTTYLGLRAGITGRVQVIRRLAVTAGSTFQYVLSSGELTSSAFFQRATVMAVDWSLGAAFALTPSIELRATADWRRYFASMNPMPGDPYIAGGAVDDNYGISVSIAFRR